MSANPFGPLVELAAPFVGAGLKSLVKSTLGMALLGLVMMVTSFYLASDGSLTRGLLALALALVTCTILGGILAAKRAVGVAILHAVDKVQLGKHAMELVFEQLLGVDESGRHGERGGPIARVAENLPLAAAEEKLASVVAGLIAAPVEGGGPSGWLRRKILASLLRRIELVTLAWLRDADQEGQGVNLVLVRNDLAGRIDGLLADRARGAMLTVTLVLVGLTVVLSCGGALAIRQLPI